MGHWYDRDGKARHKVPYADPKKGMRDTTLRDARKHGYTPSSTGAIDIMDKPQLTNWKVKEAVWSALTLPRELDESDDEFMANVLRDGKEKAKIAADEGTRIHHAIESAFKGRVVDSAYFEIAHKVKNFVVTKYSGGRWISEATFCHPLGYGGCVDLHRIHPPIVIDFKTKEELKPKMAYDEQVMQLASYARGLGIPDARLVNIFVGWNGDIVPHEWTPEEAQRGLEGFDLCLKLWAWKHKYDPCFEDRPF